MASVRVKCVVRCGAVSSQPPSTRSRGCRGCRCRQPRFGSRPLHAAATGPATCSSRVVARGTAPGVEGSGSEAARLEDDLLSALQGGEGMASSPSSRSSVDGLVRALEANGGIGDPTRAPCLSGRWRLLFTTKPGTASPIQRAFTGAGQLAIYQDVSLQDEGSEAKVVNVVQFPRGAGELRVEADAITDARPKEGFQPRRGEGIPFLGKSDNTPPSKPNKRVDFQFVKAAFDVFGVKFPYPVPFRLLQDESKGWLDTTYLSERLRISRGNKGTLFILSKVDESSDTDNGFGSSSGSSNNISGKAGLVKALEASSSTEEVQRIVDGFIASQPTDSATLDMTKLVGSWKLEWTSQGSNANWLQKLSTSFENYQVIEADEGAISGLENVAKFAPFLVLRAQAKCRLGSSEANKVDVNISGAELSAGPLQIPVNLQGNGWVKVLYVDDDLRISSGSKGSMFVHSRCSQPM